MVFRRALVNLHRSPCIVGKVKSGLGLWLEWSRKCRALVGSPLEDRKRKGGGNIRMRLRETGW
jgi:hypothetical protein